jgi:two-component system, NtrC family, sensor kinase
VQTIELEETQKRQLILDDLAQSNRDLHQTQVQLIQAEKMASLGSLVAGIAHEINTPVGAINSMHDTLVRAVAKLEVELDKKLPQEHPARRVMTASFQVIGEANRVIATGTERVRDIVRSLRNFARLDEADWKRVDLHEGIESTLALVQHDLKNRIELIKDYGAIPLVECFPGRLNQVFLNLLVNAAQAIEGKGQITIGTWKENDRVYVMFQDTGKGISPENVSRIFESGFTTKKVGMGTGLGLSICSQIVKAHQGEILVESKVGKGTIFTVVLPVVQQIKEEILK